MKRASRIHVINAIVFLALFVSFFVFYLKDQTTKFMKGSTTFASRTEEVDMFKIPVFFICFEPGYKPSIYGNISADLASHFEIQTFITEEQKLSDFLKSASYKLDEDIQIELIMFDGGKMKDKRILKDGQNTIDNFLVDVYQINTIADGYCYVVESAEKVSPWVQMSVVVKDLNSENGDKLSNLNLFIASNETWYGIIAVTWPYFKLTKYKYSFNEPKMYHWIDLSVTSISYQKGHKSVEECIENWMSTNDVCKKCSPFFHSFKNKKPSCQSNEDNKCWYLWSFFGKNFNNYKRCLKPMETTLFTGISLPFERPLVHNSTVNIAFAYSSDEIKIEEETLMIGTSSYIGSVGGSLGLFLGFSCFTYLSCCIQKVFELCDKFKQ